MTKPKVIKIVALTANGTVIAMIVALPTGHGITGQSAINKTAAIETVNRERKHAQIEVWEMSRGHCSPLHG